MEEWKEAIRWFFLVAKDQKCDAEGDPAGWLPERSKGWPEWRVAFLTTVRRRKYSYRTEQSYLVWIQRFARHLSTEDLRTQGAAQVSEFLDSLALNERLSASSQRQALNALVFLYREVFEKDLGDFSEYGRARARTNLPVWLTREELQRFFECLDEQSRLMAQVMYGSGLRLMDLLRLRVKDLGFEEEILTVRAGKGDKDRFDPLAHALIEPLRAHLGEIRKVFDADRVANVAGVWLPGALERKYPNAGKEWPWFWLWPDKALSLDPRAGVMRRHHGSDRSFQAAVKAAASKAELNKRVTPHVDVPRFFERELQSTRGVWQKGEQSPDVEHATVGQPLLVGTPSRSPVQKLRGLGAWERPHNEQTPGGGALRF